MSRRRHLILLLPVFIMLARTHTGAQTASALDTLLSRKTLGCIVEENRTTFRLFAPRAISVRLVLYSSPTDESGTENLMARDADGVWELSVPFALYNRFYGYRVSGPEGPGEMFNPDIVVADPYSRAVATKNSYRHPAKTLILDTMPKRDAKCIWDLASALDASIPDPVREIDKDFLLPIEDVFSIKGRGTVGTGRIERGRCKVGDEVEVFLDRIENDPAGTADFPMLVHAATDLRDPAVADYPMGWGNTKPNGSWFRLGFPSAYVTDVLQVLEALVEAGAGGDARLDRAVAWLLGQQDDHGRWANRYAYAGKMVVDIDAPGAPSRWVTLRACRVLRAIG